MNAYADLKQEVETWEDEDKRDEWRGRLSKQTFTCEDTRNDQ